MSTEQRENLDAVLRQSAFPADSDVDEQRRLLRVAIGAGVMGSCSFCGLCSCLEAEARYALALIAAAEA